MYHSLFICPSIERYLGNFQVLAIMNKTAIKLLGFCVDWSSIHLGKYQAVWLLHLMVKVQFSKKLTYCLPKCLYHFVLPSAMNESSSCFTSSSAFGIVSVLDFGHSNRCIVVSHCYFFFKYLFIYLFIWLHHVFVAAHGIFIAACGIFHCGSCCGMWASL